MTSASRGKKKIQLHDSADKEGEQTSTKKEAAALSEYESSERGIGGERTNAVRINVMVK